MKLWRYVAAPLDQPRSGAQTTGELAGVSAADVRASLRRAGLQALDIRPLRRGATSAESPLRRLLEPLTTHVYRHLRTRRRSMVGEMFDSLATMLEAGIPLLAAFDALIGRQSRRRRVRRRMLLEVRESLRAGSSLSQAMAGHPGWVDATDVAMVSTGQRRGDLGDVLREMATTRGRAGQLATKVTSALAYPFIVLLVGLGVVVFLSTKVLPDLTVILADSEVPIPQLTSVVMAIGQQMFRIGPLVVALGSVVALTGLVLAPLLRSKLGVKAMWPAWMIPHVLRQVQTAQVFAGLANMSRVGVPLVEGIRVLSPSVGGLGTAGLRQLLLDAADRVEAGRSVAESIDDDRWFDEETRRLIAIGESSGELPDVLDRIAERQQRAAHRAIDQFVSLLEPAMILLLAALVGLIVMAAILPLIRLQEVL